MAEQVDQLQENDVLLPSFGVRNSFLDSMFLELEAQTGGNLDMASLKKEEVTELLEAFTFLDALMNPDVKIKKDDFIEQFESIIEKNGSTSPLIEGVLDFFKSQKFTDEQFQKFLQEGRDNLKKPLPQVILQAQIAAADMQTEFLERTPITSEQRLILAQPQVNVNKIVNLFEPNMDFVRKREVLIAQLGNYVMEELKMIQMNQQKIERDIQGRASKALLAENIINAHPNAIDKKSIPVRAAMWIEKNKTNFENVFSLRNLKNINDYPLVVLMGKNVSQNIGKSDRILRQSVDTRLRKIFSEDLPINFFAQLEQHFTRIGSIEDLRKGLKEESTRKETKEKTRMVAKLLETIPDQHQDEKWGEKYEEYVLEKGSLALNFESWYELQEVPAMDYLRYDIVGKLLIMAKSTFKGVMGNDFEIASQAQRYKDLIADNVPGSEEGIKKEEKKKKEKETPAKSTAFYRNLEKLFEDNNKEKSQKLNLTYNGTSLDKAQIKEGEFSTDKIRNMLIDYPNSVKLLSQGLDIKDILFLVEHRGKNNPDGVDMDFGDNSLNISYDLNTVTDYFLLSTVGQAGAGLGGAVGFLGFYKKFRSFKKATPLGIVTAVAGYVLGDTIGELDVSLFDESFDYNDSPEKIAGTIKNAQVAVKKIEEFILRNLKKIDDQKNLDRAKINELRSSDAFEEIIEQIPGKFWGDYKLTAEDVTAFLNLQGKDIEGGFDDGILNGVFDTFHKEGIDSGDFYIDTNGDKKEATADMDGFEVDGTGTVWGNLTLGFVSGTEDLKFIDVEGFFTFLRKNDPKSKQNIDKKVETDT